MSGWRVDGDIGGWIYRWMEGWVMNGWGWMDGWINEWMEVDGWMGDGGG